MLGEKASATENIKETLKNYIKKFEDGFDNWKALKDTIYELEEDGDFYKCSCAYGSKRYFCKHNVALSIKLKNYKIPDNALSVNLAEKRKRGRPVKNKGWWSKE